MKNLFLLLFVFLFSIVAKSQGTASHNDFESKILKDDKKSIIKRSIVITNEDAEIFWPLYEEYNFKMKSINDQYVLVLREYTDKHGELTFAEAMDLWEEAMDLKQDLLNLEKRYYKKMINGMSPVKVVTYFEIERALKAKVDIELLKQIPELSVAVN